MRFPPEPRIGGPSSNVDHSDDASGRHRARRRVGVALRSCCSTANTGSNFLTGSGVAQGALIAAIALGVVLTYRGSGVVNFANGAIAMYVAYVYTVLRSDGALFLPPLPNPLTLVEGVVHLFQKHKTFRLPTSRSQISFGSSMSFWPRWSSRWCSACCSGSRCTSSSSGRCATRRRSPRSSRRSACCCSSRRSSSAASTRRRSRCGRCPFLHNRSR